MTNSATFHTYAMQAGLVPRASLRTQVSLVRHLYVTADIAATLDGPNRLIRFSAVKVNLAITNYLLGRKIDVSREDRKWKKGEEPDFVKIVGADELWEFCFRDPRPGHRLFGRFLEEGVFIGLRLIDRHDVDYVKIAGEILEEWNAKFPGIDPVNSSNLADYLGGVWRDVDAEDD